MVNPPVIRQPPRVKRHPVHEAAAVQRQPIPLNRGVGLPCAAGLVGADERDPCLGLWRLMGLQGNPRED